MFSNFKRLSFRHKNNKQWYYILNYTRLFLPLSFFQKRLAEKLASIKVHDADYIRKRVDYYNRLEILCKVSTSAIRLSDFKLAKNQKTYFFDCHEYTRYFNPQLKAHFLFGDISYVPDVPSIVKSRPIEGDVTNSVVLKLDKIRHFLFVNDKKRFEDKKYMLVGRSKARQAHRLRFLEMYFDHPICNIGQVNTDVNLKFLVNRMTISEHLDYKFILCLEGNDVASNLKWVMSSNSLAVMPKPIYETWFMEGTLIPNYHYVQIKDDYSDLEDQLSYYNTHTKEALKIIKNAQLYVSQFKNYEQEDLISFLVLEKYFQKTQQLQEK
jgi:hypothetical protein